jgi:lipopolysaccharide/colanic/teichoic acid biosynthesis glycosyltransferase
LIKLTSKGPVLFVQKRAGKDGKVFRMFKFRTMKLGASRLQRRYMSLNEADGPVFKIYNDPRFTGIGKLLSRTGLDELPQLINILKGEMSTVGPRPLPLEEARRLSKYQKVRELVKPGITSNWVVSGSHALSFDKWMKLDRKYVYAASFTEDLSIVWKTLVLIIGYVLKYIIF